MVLKIKTFANQKPCTFFKALGHPWAVKALEELKKKAEKAGIDEKLLIDLVRGIEDIKAGRVKPWRKMKEEIKP